MSKGTKAVMTTDETITSRSLRVDQLLLDNDNPRHEITMTQREAIHEMIEGQKEKMSNLANDIAINGLDRSSLLIVMPHQEESDKFIVLEGNRRLTAIKLLLEPSLAELGGSQSFQKQIKEASNLFQSKFKAGFAIGCVVYSSREEANPWILKRHTGENEGIGLSRWDSTAIARFRERNGIPSLPSRVIQFVKDNAPLDEQTRENIDKTRIITNLERLLKDDVVQSVLGIEIQGDVIKSHLPVEEVVKGLSKMVADLANKKINVNDIRHKTDRKQYIETFDSSDIPDQKKRLDQSWDLSETPVAGNGLNDVGGEEKLPQNTNSKRRSNPSSLDRKMLIPSNCVIRIKHDRLSEIYRELKNIEVEHSRNACSVLMRVFFEGSIDNYLKTKPVVGATEKSKLKEKVAAMINHFINNGIMEDKELKPARTMISAPDSIFSIDTMHAYVHNINFTPSAKDLKAAWNNIQPFVENMWR